MKTGVRRAIQDPPWRVITQTQTHYTRTDGTHELLLQPPHEAAHASPPPRAGNGHGQRRLPRIPVRKVVQETVDRHNIQRPLCGLRCGVTTFVGRIVVLLLRATPQQASKRVQPRVRSEVTTGCLPVQGHVPRVPRLRDGAVNEPQHSLLPQRRAPSQHAFELRPVCGAVVLVVGPAAVARRLLQAAVTGNGRRVRD